MSSIVVADAGPLHYLVLIDCGEILGRLFDHVVIPFAVRDELLHLRAPQKVKDWIISPRPWLELVPVTQPQPVHGLHRGETEALQLALERRADAVLMDDLAAARLRVVLEFQRSTLSQSWSSPQRRVSSSCRRQLRSFSKPPFSFHRIFSTLLWNATKSDEKRESDRV